MAVLCTAAPAAGRVLKVDGLPADPEAFAAAVAESRPGCVPDFGSGQSYGVLLPTGDDAPFHILSIDVYQADLCNPEGECGTSASNPITIRLWIDEGLPGDGETPALGDRAADLTLRSREHVDPDTGVSGLPARDDTYTVYRFAEADRPEVTTPGAVLRVTVEMEKGAAAFTSVYPECAPGCQDPCPAIDGDGITPRRNLVRTAAGWAWAEDSERVFPVTGDWVLRVVTDAPEPVEPGEGESEAEAEAESEAEAEAEAEAESEAEAEAESEAESEAGAESEGEAGDVGGEAEAEAESEGDGAPCAAHDDCPGGRLCRDGACVALCDADADCGEGRHCAADHTCRDACEAHADCRGGEVCEAARCVPVAEDGGCGCAIGARPPPAPPAPPAPLVALLALARGRRRPRRGRP